MSFPRYPSYKDSGVEWLGQVPEHWEVKPLKAVTTHNDDVLDETTAPDTEIAYVDISSVDGVNGINAKESMLFSAAPSRARRRVKHGDVIVSTVRTYLRAIARIREPEDNLVVSTGFAVVRPRDVLVPDFLGNILSASYFVEQVIARSTGVSYPAINASELVAIPVTVPPKDEQADIAEFLDRETGKIDDLVAEQRRLMELLKEKRQAVISHAVTRGLNPATPLKPSGIEWLGEVPAHWELRRLRQISPRLAGRLVVQPHLYFEDEGVPIVFGNNIRRGRICKDEIKYISFEADRRFASCKVASGDLLTVRVGDPGATAVVPPELDGCHFASTMLIRQAPAFDSNWLCHVMNSDLINSQIALVNYGAAQEQFNIGDAANFLIPFPPRDEQSQLTSFLESSTGAHDALVDEAQRAIGLLQERRTALVSAAVTGQIDVRPLAEIKTA